MSEVYAFIEAEKTTHHVALLGRLLKVARSSFYAWLAGEQARADRRAANDALAHKITVMPLPGAPARTLEQLKARGTPIERHPADQL
ncbi:hypothetical protein [Streptomyces yanii]|uniref:IS3 family transposase n=1 Tax=Streptomyces yanii TaxID=78510 RepID=A0ABV5RIL2_9ACTN